MKFLTLVQIVISILLISTILLQSKGTGLGSAWGGGGSATYHSKRGLEKVLFKLTIGLAVLFIVTSILALL
jgi:preprotein translocase subunit SecG